MTSLGSELQRRGHRVTLVGIRDAQPNTLAAGLEFRAIGESDFPKGAMRQIFVQQGNLSGLAAVRYTLTWVKNITATLIGEAPEVLKEAGVDSQSCIFPV